MRGRHETREHEVTKKKSRVPFHLFFVSSRLRVSIDEVHQTFTGQVLFLLPRSSLTVRALQPIQRSPANGPFSMLNHHKSLPIKYRATGIPALPSPARVILASLVLLLVALP